MRGNVIVATCACLRVCVRVCVSEWVREWISAGVSAWLNAWASECVCVWKHNNIFLIQNFVRRIIKSYLFMKRRDIASNIMNIMIRKIWYTKQDREKHLPFYTEYLQNTQRIEYKFTFLYRIIIIQISIIDINVDVVKRLQII